MRWIVRILGGLALLAALAFIGFYGYLKTSLPQESGTIRLAGPTGAIEIIRDRNGIPHIFATSAGDAYFALGFVHAQDRLAQMELMRRTAEGRLSEYAGAVTLPHDRFVRTLGLRRQAEAGLAVLSPELRSVFDAYTAGVNALIDTHSGAWPPEFLLIGAPPARWRPVDSLLWGRLMALQLLGNWRDELTRARLADRLTPEMRAELWPAHPADMATTLAARSSTRGGLDLEGLARALPAPLGPSQASNIWVLAGTRTISGFPLLVNDPHLGLNAPDIWYLVRISAPGLTLVGATTPGVPLLILGHNGHIAWGFTTTNADTSDLFIEKPLPGDPARYATPEGPRPFDTRQEMILVRGTAPVTHNVRSTRHGVVISDLGLSTGDGAAAGEVLSLAWAAAAEPDTTSEALFRLNRARNWAEFTDALKLWHAPVQNVAYADIEGHTGFSVAGRVPYRKVAEGWLPHPGWTVEYDWDGFVPPADLPRVLDPASGRIVNANNRVVPNAAPVFISRDWDWPDRAARIVELLDQRAKHDIANMESVLADPVSRFARRMMPLFSRVRPVDEASRTALMLLAKWDGAMRRDRPEPLIFTAWMRELTISLLSRRLGDSAGDVLRERPALLLAAFEDKSAFCGDPPAPEAGHCADIIGDALARALETLAARYGADLIRWRWGAAHIATFPHPVFAMLPGLRQWVAFNQPTDGDYFTVNRGATRLADGAAPFAHVHGATLRAIYDLGDLDNSRFIIAPGQSGNPLSAHWDDLLDAWASGRHLTIAGDRARLVAEGGRRLVLAPR